MCRRILAACLAVCILLLTFGCGKKGTQNGTTTRGDVSANAGKIAIVIGDRSQAPEICDAASELAQANGDSVLLIKYAQNFYSDPNAVTNIATAAAQNENVKAILFADGVKGTGAAVKAVRAARKDICIVVCNPHESSTEMKGADMVVSVDFPALGQAMVEKAKELGAENFVFYTNERHLKYSSVIALRSAVESICKNEGIKVKVASCVDLYEEGRTLNIAKQYLIEDIPRRAKEFGKKTALVCTEPMIQSALAAQAIANGLVMPATFLPSPLSLAGDLGVDLTGHETDSAYALEQLRAKDVGAAGTVATWSFSAYIAFLQAAFEYASGVLNGSGKATSIDSVKTLLENHTAGAEVTVTTDANGAYLVQSELVTL